MQRKYSYETAVTIRIGATVMESRPAFDSSVIIEDYFASPLPKQNTLIASTPLKIANLIRLRNEFAWEGSLESLKEFIKD